MFCETPLPPPFRCCVGAVVCAVEDRKKQHWFGGKGGKCDPDDKTIEFYHQVCHFFCHPL